MKLNGDDFVALMRLSTADDETLANVGETCGRVNPDSLPLLLDSGRIRAKASPVVETPVAEDHDDSMGDVPDEHDEHAAKSEVTE